MSTHKVSTKLTALGFTALVAGSTIVAAAGTASAEVTPGVYTSTTLSAGSVLLAREGRVENGRLNLIGSYPIHDAPDGGYFIDFFPGHRVYMNDDGQGGYEGPAFLFGIPVGTFELNPVN